nr:MAG TPA: hypothetical protein [Caudoviricetes sp.]
MTASTINNSTKVTSFFHFRSFLCYSKHFYTH